MRKCNPLFILIAVVLCMTAFLLPAYAQASDGEAAAAQEPSVTEEKASVPETPLTPKGNLTLVDDVEQKGDAKGKEQSKQFQIECLTNELVTMLMEERGMTMEQAMDTVYGSHTYEKVERASTGLYYQGAVYIMDMLREEIDAA